MDYPWAERFGALARKARIAAVGARADRGIHGPPRARQEVPHGGRDARPLGRDRGCREGRARRLPPRFPARSHAPRHDHRRLQAARRAPRAPRGQGPRRALRRRGDGPRPRLRQPRRRDRDLSPHRLGPPRARLRASARHKRRRLHRASSRSRRPWRRQTACSSRARPSTSTSPTSPTRTATRRSTCPTARARSEPTRWPRRWTLRPAGDCDQRVARPGVDSGDSGHPHFASPS